MGEEEDSDPGEEKMENYKELLGIRRITVGAQLDQHNEQIIKARSHSMLFGFIKLHSTLYVLCQPILFRKPDALKHTGHKV